MCIVAADVSAAYRIGQMAEGRPVEPDLLTAAGRRRRLTDALAVAPRRAAHLPFLAREHASARAVTASA